MSRGFAAQPAVVEPRARGAVERDISLEEAARQLGHAPRNLREVWTQIPTAYITERGRYWVNPVGLRRWLQQRGASSESNANSDAEAATSASSGRA